MEQKNLEQKKDSKGIKIIFIFVLSLLSIFIIYFVVWRNISTSLLKNVSEVLESNSTFDSIDYSGFPFKKIIKVKNLSLNSKTSVVFSKNQITVSEITLESNIFSSKMDLGIENIKIVNSQDKKSYNAVYKQKPVSVISFYSDGRLDSFEYMDNGYDVIDSEKKQLFSTGDLSLEINGDNRNGDSIDYVLSGDMKDIAFFDNEGIKSIDIYSFLLNGNMMVERSDEDEEKNNINIKLETAKLIKNNKDVLFLNADVKSDGSDKTAYGTLNITLQDYKKVIEDLQKEAIETIKSGGGVNKKLTKEEQKEYLSILIGITLNSIELIEKNPQTKKGVTGVISLTRKPGDNRYFVNGEDMNAFVSALMLLR